MSPLLLVNFGGPRHLDEVSSFLSSLLCDRDVIRTRFPQPLHNWIFRRAAKKRAVKVRHDYAQIGGRSPIYFDTEALASALSQRLKVPVLTLHRYLPETHLSSLEAIASLQTLKVLPLFPQFSYATTGSVARLLSSLPSQKLRWIKSYPAHPAFIGAYQKRIADFLREKKIREKEVVLLFSAHGLPQSFIDTGDIYESECRLSFQAVMQAFPEALGRLAYQSKFGPGLWLKPYTDISCEQILDWNQDRKEIVFVPISFTSDHIETLFEIEHLYLPLIRAKGLNAHRCPALNQEPYWIEALADIAQETNLCNTQMLVRW